MGVGDGSFPWETPSPGQAISSSARARPAPPCRTPGCSRLWRGRATRPGWPGEAPRLCRAEQGRRSDASTRGGTAAVCSHPTRRLQAPPLGGIRRCVADHGNRESAAIQVTRARLAARNSRGCAANPRACLVSGPGRTTLTRESRVVRSTAWIAFALAASASGLRSFARRPPSFVAAAITVRAWIRLPAR